MDKLTTVSTAHIVSHHAADRAGSAGVAGAANKSRKVDPAWIEFTDHVLADKLPFLAIGLELGRALQTGRVPLRAVLLMAVLLI